MPGGWFTRTVSARIVTDFLPLGIRGAVQLVFSRSVLPVGTLKQTGQAAKSGP
jgi:hypothetical protein